MNTSHPLILAGFSYSHLSQWLVANSIWKCPVPVYLAHLPLGVCRPSVIRLSLAFCILINSSKTTGPIWTKLWWNCPWMAPFQNCVRWSRLPSKMAAKLKIEKRGGWNFNCPLLL
jgi:hypothetical protein